MSSRVGAEFARAWLSVFCWKGFDLTGRRLQTLTFRCQHHLARRECGADGDAVHAALSVDPEVVDRIRLAAVVAAAPDGRAVEFEIHARLGSRTALAVRIHDFDIEERH